MPNEHAVTEIVQKSFKSGTSAKTGKPWVIHKYKSNEVEFTSFDDLEIGDLVKLEQTEYGWQGSRPRKADAQHEEIMKALREIYTLLKKLAG